jgi:hypothetical protein
METSKHTWVGRVASCLLLIVVVSAAQAETTKPAISVASSTNIMAQAISGGCSSYEDPEELCLTFDQGF